MYGFNKMNAFAAVERLKGFHVYDVEKNENFKKMIGMMIIWLKYLKMSSKSDRFFNKVYKIGSKSFLSYIN